MMIAGSLKTGVIFLILVLTFQSASAQYFGRNKPRYKKIDFKVFETPHFEVYHYLNNDSLVDYLAKSSESWYFMHQRVLKDTIRMLNPIIFYANHADFQQTNTISSSVSVGTGGVTEALKNRVIMPVTESNYQTDHVLGHEMVHAFQYNMIINSEDSSLSLNNIRNIPLWMVEGLAEYMSIGSQDAHTAMWMRDALQNDDLPTIKDLTTTNEYFPYRYGHAFWSFLTGVFGDTIVRPMYLNVARYGYDEGIKRTAGVSHKVLSERWHNSIKNYYQPYRNAHSSPLIGRAVISEENAGRMNISPAISPNGQYVIFLSEKDIFTIDLYLANAKSGEIIRKVSSSAQNAHIDAFAFLESSGAWSPDSRRFAYVVFSRGRNKIAISDVAEGEITEEIEVPGVPAINNLTWSPDGNTLAFTGLVNGQSDIYTYNLRTKNVRQLTDDHFSDLQPHYLPDNETIVFSSDRFSSFPDREGYKYGSYRIAFVNTQTKDIDVLNVFPGADNLNPVMSPDRTSVIFLSNKDGFRNMYRYELNTGSVFQMTNYFSGISGITPFAPAISIARNQDLMAYVYYDKGKYTIFSAPLGNFLNRKVDPYEVDFGAAILPPANPYKLSIVEANLSNRFFIRDTLDVTRIPKNYKPKFKLDYIGSTGIGVTTSRFGTGMAGGVNTIFSDILGDNQLYAGASLNGEIYDFGGQVAYINRKSRVQWGFAASHIPYRYGYYSFNKDTIPDQLDVSPNDSIPVDDLTIHIRRIFEDQLVGFFFVPFSTTRRIEFETSIAWYSNRYDRIHNYYFDGFRYPVNDRENNLPAPDGYHLERLMAAYVGDNSFFGTTAPLKGSRFRIQGEQYFGKLNLFTTLIDYRKYFFLNPFSIAFRGYHYARYGDEAANDLLPPIFLGAPGLIRGYPTNEFFFGDPEGLSINNLLGNRVLLGNLELRIPFTGPPQLAIIKSGFLFSDLNVFVDAGYAWELPEQVVITETMDTSYETKPIYSAGVSLRVNLFGALIIEPYYAVPFSREDRSPVFGLQFLPGW
jgi:Tol biopolymer transport system component